MEDMVVMDVDTMARERQMLRLRLMLSQAISPEDMEAMVMVVMEVTEVATTERGRLMLRLDTTVDTPEDMEVMEVTDVATMERGRLKLRLDTPEDMEDMDMVVMVVMAVHMEVMVDMVIAVKFLPLFIIPPPIIDIL